MAKGEIEKGSTVRLKSGGPAMTVIRMQSPEEVVVSWFPDFTKPNSATFPLIALELAAV